MPHIRKPELGRPADSRLTADTIAADPRLTGVEPFDPARDIDIVDEINGALSVLPGPGTLGQPNGIATLDSSGKVPADQLPPQELDAEAVQDVVGTMLVGGAGTTVSYDDAAGTVTISSEGGGGGTTTPGPVYLSAPNELADVFGDLSAKNITLLGDQEAGTPLTLTFRAQSDFAFDAIRAWLGNNYPTPGTLTVWTGISPSALTQAASASIPAGGSNAGELRTLQLSSAVSVAVGDYVQVRVAGPNGYWDVLGGVNTPPTLPWLGAAGNLALTAMSHNADLTPLLEFRNLAASSVEKNVQGPMDARDFPVFTNAAFAPVASAFIVDNGTDAPYMARKRADGTVWRGVAFTPEG